jgi:hypothetical protein
MKDRNHLALLLLGKEEKGYLKSLGDAKSLGTYVFYSLPEIG